MGNPLLWFTDPNPAGLFLFLTLLALVVTLLCAALPARGETPADGDGDSVAAEALSDEEPYFKVERAIRWLTRHAPNHKARKDRRWRHLLTAYIVESAYQYDLPPLLLTSLVYKESSFKVSAIGSDRPSIGLTQVHGVAKTGCRNLDTAEGQLDCGAKWLRFCIDECDGSFVGGLASYANGGNCWPPHDSSSMRGAWAKVRLWGKLEKLGR